MKKALKFIVPGVCILVVVITFYMIFDIQSKVEENQYGTGDIVIENMIQEDNITNTENTNIQNITSNTNILDNFENTIEDDNVIAEDEDKLSSSKQEQAIALVKEYWGEDSSVYFTNEGVTSAGEYTVAVRQKTSTTVKDYFIVNLETKKVEVHY